MADHVNQAAPFGPILVEVIAVDSGPGTFPDVNQSVPRTFTIAATEVNDAPLFTVPTTVTRNEDIGPVTVPNFITGIAPGPSGARDEASQTLRVVVASSSASFISQPVVDLVAGTLQFQTAQDVNSLTGHDLVFTVTVIDSGSGTFPDVNSTTKTVTLSITPVNDVPIFTIANPVQTVFEDNELVINQPTTQIANFATNVFPARATALDERSAPPLGQTVSFTTVSVSNPGLFETTGQPTISPTGVLSFDTKTDQNGSAVVVVRLVDSGPGASPDVNTSADQTFTINVTAVNDAPVFNLPPKTPAANEDAGLITINNFATNLLPGPATATDETPQTFRIDVVAVDPTAFSRQPTIAIDGTLIYQTARDINNLSPGRDLRVRVTITDNGTAGPLPDTNVSPTRTFTVDATPVNDAPLFTLSTNNITVIEDEEAFKNIPISSFPGLATQIAPGPGTATDEVPQTVSFDIVDVSAPELFSVQPTITPQGELRFKTASNKNGKAVVITRLVDSGSFVAPNDNDSDRQTFTISITPVNDAPLFEIPATISVSEDQGLVSRPGFAFNVRRGPVGTDDENSQTISFNVIAVDPTAFEVQPRIEVDGTLTFKTAQFVNSNNANLAVRVSLQDSGVDAPPPNTRTSVEQTFTINAAPVNNAPIPDVYNNSTSEEQELVILSTDVLVGDRPGPTVDENGQQLSITQVERTTLLGGTVTPVFDALGRIVSMTYRPALDIVGNDRFLYVVSDDGSPSRSGTGTINIVINPVNDAPRFTKGSDQIVLEDTPPVSVANWATNILAGTPGAVDEQATQTVTFVVSVDRPELFEVAPAVSSTGTLTYKPAKDAVGTAVVSIFARDNGPSNPPNVNISPTTTFNVTLLPTNDAPVFTAGGVVNVNEDSTAYSQPWASGIAPAAGLLATPRTALDEAGQVVEFVLTVDRPALFSVQPTMTSAGVLDFTPAPNAFGTALITVVARDRGPAGVNDVNTSVAQTLTINIASKNDAPVAVPDTVNGDENTVLTLNAPGILANDTDVDLPNDQLRVVARTLTSTRGATVTINEDGSISYDPRSVLSIQQLGSGQSLIDTFTYQIRDNAGDLSNEATVSVVISGIDDAPVAVPDTYTVPVGQTRLLDILANDTDVDSLINRGSIVITSLPAFGTVVVGDGVVSYTAGVGFRGSDNFSYTVRDVAGNVSNEASVVIVVNNPPRASNDNTSTTRGVPTTINVLANDSDPDGSLNPATVTIASQPNPSGAVAVLADGRIQFTPAAGFTGISKFQYFVRDNVGSPSNVAEVTVAVGGAWTNPRFNLDVNADGRVTPLDALLVINYINRGRPTDLPSSGVTPPPYLDPSGDERVTAFDVLLIINYLNRIAAGGSGEGESAAVVAANNSAVEQLAAPVIVSMVTPEQIIATVGPQIVRDIQTAIVNELNAMDSTSSDDNVQVGASCSAWASTEDDPVAPIIEMVSGKNRQRSSSEFDSFFEDL